MTTFNNSCKIGTHSQAGHIFCSTGSIIIYIYTKHSIWLLPALSVVCVSVVCDGGRVRGLSGEGEGVMKGCRSNSCAGKRRSSFG